MPSSFSNTDLEYMFWAGIRNGSIGTIGTKGDPGGIVAPVTLGAGVDANTLTTSGLYRAASGNVTSALNFPRDGVGGHLLIISNTATIVTQFFYPLNSSVWRGFYQRNLVSSIWSPWQFIASQRVDQTAGRAIYQWDDLNNREQLIYGDTGWRVVSTDLINGATGVVLIRRVGWTVEIRFRIHMASATSDVAYIPPSGFGPGFSGERAYGIAQASGTPTVWECVTASGLNSTSRANSNYGSITYTTTEAWPTSLPGTANGSIPNL